MTASFKRSTTRSAWVAFAIGAFTVGAACAQPRPTPEMQALMQACRPDYATHCKAVQPGGGRIIACLRAQDAKTLTPPCRQALAKVAL